MILLCFSILLTYINSMSCIRQRLTPTPTLPPKTFVSSLYQICSQPNLANLTDRRRLYPKFLRAHLSYMSQGSSPLYVWVTLSDLSYWEKLLNVVFLLKIFLWFYRSKVDSNPRNFLDEKRLSKNPSGMLDGARQGMVLFGIGGIYRRGKVLSLLGQSLPPITCTILSLKGILNSIE